MTPDPGSQAPGGAPEIPDLLPAIPVRGRVVYPLTFHPLAIGQERSVRALEDVMRTHRIFAALTVRDEKAPPEAGPGDVYEIGCAALVQQLARAPDGTYRVVIQGIERIRVASFARTDPYLIGRVERLAWLETPGTETEALVRTVRDLFHRAAALAGLPDELAGSVDALADPRAVAYLVGTTLPFPLPARQDLLEIGNTAGLLRKVVELMQQEIAVGETQARIADETRRELTRAQREAILREQLRTIQRELGEEAPEAEEARAFRERLEKTTLPAEARREVERELSRLERMTPASPEYGMIRTWLDWVLALPWGRTTGGAIDLVEARAVLDADHYDIDEVKERLLDHLAVRKLRAERAAAPAPPAPRMGPAVGPALEAPASPGGDGAATPAPLPPLGTDEESRREPILCLVGPPGVGKTSIGQSIARAMGRRFVRLSLGGVHDEAEIRGHRRTYIGAIPGRVIQAMRRAEVADPVMMLDEIDKLSASFQGDPAAALLEVLDPAQNQSFTDAYLGMPFDLSKVLFICTGNTVETIAPPLLDRMEVVALSGYTESEKLQIARRHLLPKQLRATGLREGELEIDDAALRRIAREYTREAGVRGLERAISAVARKAARRIGEGGATPIRVGAEALPELLGRPRVHPETAERIDRPGIATGLAWTPAGGDVLFIEAAIMRGRPELVLTGMLGDVMRESAMAALTYVRSNAERLGVDSGAFERRTVHVHVPAGAIPKDGPSAGVALMTAIASAALGVPVRHDVAMTGEITLRGKVLPVGGIKEKALAAFGAGVKTVILPRRNEEDVQDIPEEARRGLRIVLVDSAEEVLPVALVERPATLAGAKAGAPPAAS
jgi:ATP-dependent Lon protease